MEDLIYTKAVSSGSGASLRRWLAIASLSILCTTALVDRVWPLMPPRLVGQEKAEYAAARRVRSVRDGSFARWVEKEAATRSRTRVILGPWWSMAMLELGDSGKRDIVAGKGRWLFLRRRAEFDARILREAPAVAANTLLALRRRLALHGCDLRFLPIPRKAAACSKRLPAGFPAHPEFDAELISRLRSGGAPTIDLLRAWEGMAPEDLYMRLDTHWEVPGQEAAARAIADQFDDLRGDLDTVELLRTQEPGPGALLRFAGFYEGHAAWDHMDGDPLHRVRLSSMVLERELAEPGATGGEQGGTVLAGTSYTAHLALHALVVSELHAPVVKVAFDGAAFTEPIEVTLGRWKAEASPPRVLILEFPIFQAVDALNRRPGATRAIGSIVQRLDLGPASVQSMPARAIYRGAKPGRKGAQMRASLRPGSILSSGDGIVQLRVEVESGAPTRWRVTTAAMDVPLHFGAGGGVAWVPLIEGAKWNGRVQVFSTDAASHGAKIAISPVLALGQDVALQGPWRATVDPASSRSAAELGAEIRPDDVLLIEWSRGEQQQRPTDVSMFLTGFREQQETNATWKFPGAVGTWAALDLSAFAGGRLDRVRVEGVRSDLTLELIRVTSGE